MTDPSNCVNQHNDKWTIPDSMVEYEKKIAVLEQRFDSLSTKFSALVEENATLRKRLEDVLHVGHNDDCIFCAAKDMKVLESQQSQGLDN